MNPFVEELVFNIYCIDVDYIRPRFACSYLVINQGKAAFIDCGTSQSVSRLLSALEHCELTTFDVEYVIPTHVHLDHAGGAGALMQSLPNATLIVHPRGARHMIDPQRLTDSARQVYGADQFDRLYGEIVPVDKERVHAANDSEIIDLNGRMLEICDTPGHARHHFCIYDEVSQGWFTGDTFGLSYPDISISDGQYLLPTTTPVQFEYDAWIESLKKLQQRNPQRMYLTHYGVVEDVPTLATKLKHDLKKYIELSKTASSSSSRLEDIINLLTDFTLTDLKNYGCQLDESTLLSLLNTDITLNAQGLDIWISKQEKT